MATPDGAAGSLWEATAVEAPALAPLASDAKAEICVVGSGFTGLSTALHLAEVGRDVVVLDRYWPGYGGSGRNGGQILPGLKWLPGELVEKLGETAGSRLADFTGRTPEIVYEMLERHGIRCGLRLNCGWLNAAATEAAATSLRKRADQFRGLGFPVRFAEEDEVARLLGTPRYRGALIDGRAGAINPLSLARELARVAKSYSARIHVRSAAIRLARAGDRWRIQDTRRLGHGAKSAARDQRLYGRTLAAAPPGGHSREQPPDSDEAPADNLASNNPAREPRRLGHAATPPLFPL